MYNACMPNIQVRNVPDDVHAELVRRAEQTGTSLQRYLVERLSQIATTPTLTEVLERIESRDKGRVGIEDAVEAVGALRAGH